MPGDVSLAELEYAYLTTTGRFTGRPHRIEIWFAMSDGVVYMLAGGRDRSDWVRNIMVSPDVVLEIGDRRRTTVARVLAPDDDDDPIARRLLVEKYGTRSGDDLTEWGRTALAVAIGWP